MNYNKRTRFVEVASRAVHVKSSVELTTPSEATAENVNRLTFRSVLTMTKRE